MSLLHVGASSEYMPRSGIAGSSGSAYAQFSKELPYWFLEWVYQIASPAAMKECSFFSTSLPVSAVIEVWNLAILTGMRYNLRVVLIYISMMTKDMEHFLAI